MKNYENYTHAQLIAELKKLSKRKKYGLVWEEEKTKEKFEAEAEGKLPVLVEDKKREIKTDADLPAGQAGKPTHILIEGDNYHALSVLNYTHAKSIDVICIDPPYNTGARNWKYNNDFVEREDAYRHSKFINFLNNRFILAKKLLSEKGIIICAIDDYEVHNVRHLMDFLFGEENRLGTIVVVHNPRGRNDDKYFATMHEYMLIYAKNKDKVKIKHFELNEDEIDKYNKQDEISVYNETSFVRTGNNSKRQERPNLFYPIYFNEKLNELSLLKKSGFVELLPINEAREEKTWRWGKETFLEKKDTELLVRKVKDNFRIFKKRRITNIEGTKPKTIWHDSKYDASSNGIMLLQNILGKENNFPYPKSLYTIYDILQLTTDKDSIVLDYFAGSGTTGHAIHKLNEKDGGARKYILCTNNEGNICADITYPRIKKVIEGYKNTKGQKIDGLGGNLKYYKTNFVGSEPTHRNKKLLTDKSIEMLCIKENTFDEVLKSPLELVPLAGRGQRGVSYCIYSNNEKFTAILFDEMKMEEFKNEIKKLKMPVSVYVFSLEGDDFKEEFVRMDSYGENLKNDITLCSIPEAILKVYRRIYGAGHLPAGRQKWN